MTARTYGLLAGAGAVALGAWWWNRNRSTAATQLTPARERGTVIFDNTPTASEALDTGVA